MASLNKVLLIGNLTRDPEVRYTPGGAAVCEFGLAINRRYMANNQEQNETCFVEIVVWGKQAESCGRYLEKGAPVFIEGRLKFDQWQDKNTGAKRSKLQVVAERVQFLSRNERRNTDGNGTGWNNNATAGQQGQYSAPGGYNQPQYGNSGNTAPGYDSGNNVPPSPPANAFDGGSGYNAPPQPPQPPAGAFNDAPVDGAEDDIPF